MEGVLKDSLNELNYKLFYDIACSIHVLTYIIFLTYGNL